MAKKKLKLRSQKKLVPLYPEEGFIPIYPDGGFIGDVKAALPGILQTAGGIGLTALGAGMTVASGGALTPVGAGLVTSGIGMATGGAGKAIGDISAYEDQQTQLEALERDQQAQSRTPEYFKPAYSQLQQGGLPTFLYQARGRAMRNANPEYFLHGGNPEYAKYHNLSPEEYQIEVEKDELKTRKGKIIEDYKNLNPHINNGFREYIDESEEAKKDTIITAKSRNKYLDSELMTRLGIENRLVRDQAEKEQVEQTEEIESFAKGGLPYFSNEEIPEFSEYLTPPEPNYIVIPKPKSPTDLEVLEYKRQIANAKAKGKLVLEKEPSFYPMSTLKKGKLMPKKAKDIYNQDLPVSEFGKGGMNFKSSGAYKRWLGYGHATGVFARTPGHQKVSIKGQSKKVKHMQGGGPTLEGYEDIYAQGFPTSQTYRNYGFQGAPLREEPFSGAEWNPNWGFGYPTSPLQYQTSLTAKLPPNTFPKVYPSEYSEVSPEQTGMEGMTYTGAGQPSPSKKIPWGQIGTTTATALPAVYNYIASLRKTPEEEYIKNLQQEKALSLFGERYDSAYGLRQIGLTGKAHRRDLAQRGLGQGQIENLMYQSSAEEMKKKADYLENVRIANMERNFAEGRERLGTGEADRQAKLIARGETLRRERNKAQFLPTALGQTSYLAQSYRNQELKRDAYKKRNEALGLLDQAKSSGQMDEKTYKRKRKQIDDDYNAEISSQSTQIWTPGALERQGRPPYAGGYNP